MNFIKAASEKVQTVVNGWLQNNSAKILMRVALYVWQAEMRYGDESGKGEEKRNEVIAHVEKYLHDILPDFGDKALDLTEFDEQAIGWLIDSVVEAMQGFFSKSVGGSSK